MRSRNRNEIEIVKVEGMGSLPPYVDLGQRHLEKEMPKIHNTGGQVTVTVPTDLMRLVLPSEQVDEIESLEFVYAKR